MSVFDRLRRGDTIELDARVVRGLVAIVLACVGTIGALAIVSLFIAGGVIGTDVSTGDEFRQADEVTSVLGNLGAAGVGALAGYFTARYVHAGSTSTGDTATEPDPRRDDTR